MEFFCGQYLSYIVIIRGQRDPLKGGVNPNGQTNRKNAFFRCGANNLLKRPEYQPSWMPEVVMTKVSYVAPILNFLKHSQFGFFENNS